MDPLDPRTPPVEASPEEGLRAEVSVGELVEDHPDPAGAVEYEPLQPPGQPTEAVDGW